MNSEDKDLADLLAEHNDPAATAHLEGEDADADEDVESLLRQLDPDPEPEPEPESTEIIEESVVRMDADGTNVVVVNEDEHAKQFAAEMLNNYRAVAHTIIGRFQEDREEIQEVLDFLKDRVYTDSEASESIVAALAATVKTKADATSHTVRILDAFSKFISATKNSSILGNQQSSTADMLELAKLLTKGEFPDELKVKDE